MSKRARTRSILAGLAVVGLLAACGDDDDPVDDASTTTEAESTDPDEGTDEATDDGGTDGGTDIDDTSDEAAVDICGLLDIPTINELTGEEFTEADRFEDDSCRLTNADETATLQLSLHILDEGETEAGFVGEGSEACEPGTVRDDVDFSFADGGGVACTVEGQATVIAGHDGAAGLLIGHPSFEVPEDQLFAVMAQILEGIVTQ